jgi:3-dehydroquinate dehydratase/shikimate dehydrogenase
MTHLCVPILVNDVAQAQRDVAQAIEAGADMVELRIDRHDDPRIAQDVISDFDAQFIVTCRAEREGGQSTLGDQQRVGLLAIIAPTDDTVYLDIELETIRRVGAGVADNPIITSAHDFTGRPARLYNLIDEMNGSVGRVNKVAWMARSIRDNLEAFELLGQRQKPTIALCMGEAGLISRVLARKFGAFLTFASLGGDDATAPGQVSVADMKRLYRWDAIGPRTKVYGVVACPVMHSMSPAIHNASFEHVQHDGVYLPLLVQEGYESFKAFMESFLAFPGLDLAGLSVTIPHKENALRYLREKNAPVEPLAESIGAVNTIIIDKDTAQPIRGLNTDYAAILDTITAALGIDARALAGERVAVVGAGGTGRTAVAALAHCGATVTVANRTPQRAQDLAREFDGRSGKASAVPMDQLADCDCRIWINTTSVGMHPRTDQSPLDERTMARIGKGVLVFDTVYNPPQTTLLRQAQAAGAQTVGGVEMFIRQAARQFEAWTLQPAPVEIMRRVINQRLGQPPPAPSPAGS